MAQRVKEMVEIKEILDCYEKYGSIKKTAQRLDVSINTVRRYLRQMKQMENGELPDFLTANPVVIQPSRVLTDEVKKKIHGYLESSECNRGKQRITAKRIHQLLTTRDGYSIGYTTVKDEVRRWKREHSFRETFIEQEPPVGWRGEFDFADVVLCIGREECTFSCGGMVLPFSLYRFGRLFRHSGHLEVVQTHIDFFNEIGAVPETIFYDRLGVVYNSRLKRLNDNFLRFAVHYGFTPHVCNAASPQEKGTDEETVGYIRRYAFGERDSFDTFQEACQWFSTCIDEINHLPAYRRDLTPAEGLEVERTHMKPLPSLEYTNCHTRRATLNKYSMVRYENTFYSVPTTYRGRTITMQAYVDTVRLIDGEQVIATHPRRSNSPEPVSDIRHYIKTFHRKPRALANSKVFNQCDPRLKHLFTHQCRGDPKEFLPILDLVNDTSEEAFCGVLDLLSEENMPITYDTLRFFLFQNPVQMIEPFDFQDAFSVPKPDLDTYDDLLRRRRE